MKARTMRLIDWYAGVPLCYLLALYESVRRLFPRRKGEVKTVLFIKFFGIGSIVLSSAAVAAARGAFPGAKIHYLTFSSNRETLALLGCADFAHYVDTRSLGSFIASTLRAIAALRRAKVDLVFDLEFFAKFPLVVATLIGARRKAGFYLTYESWRHKLLDDLGYYNHYWHIKDIFLSLVYLAKEQDPYYLRFGDWAARYTPAPVPIDAGAIKRVQTLLKANGWTEGRPLLVVNPNAGKDLAPVLKRWPNGRWVELAQGLLTRYPDALIIGTGSTGEAPLIESIITKLPAPLQQSVRNGAGRFSLAELLALFSIAKVFITIDSGPMHLAALTGVPIVGLFFAESPVLYAPLSKKSRIIQPPAYSIPSFTVYMGKDPIVPSHNKVAELVKAAEVLDALASLV